MCWVCVLLFFKQKTADELGISDWSSDVCSSDLDLDRGIGPGRRAAVVRAPLDCPDHPWYGSACRPADLRLQMVVSRAVLLFRDGGRGGRSRTPAVARLRPAHRL